MLSQSYNVYHKCIIVACSDYTEGSSLLNGAVALQLKRFTRALMRCYIKGTSTNIDDNKKKLV